MIGFKSSFKFIQKPNTVCGTVNYPVKTSEKVRHKIISLKVITQRDIGGFTSGDNADACLDRFWAHILTASNDSGRLRKLESILRYTCVSLPKYHSMASQWLCLAFDANANGEKSPRDRSAALRADNRASRVAARARTTLHAFTRQTVLKRIFLGEVFRINIVE